MNISGIELYDEFFLFWEIIENDTSTLQIKKKFLPIVLCWCPNVTILLRIVLTLLVITTTVKRSVSKLKLIKNYLRNTLNQEKLTNLALISIQCEIKK